MTPSCHRAGIALALLAQLATPFALADVGPRVVASVRPLHAIAAAVMEGVAEPALALSGNASPHTASLRPSTVRLLHEADLLVWVGPGLETAIARAVGALGPEVDVLTLLPSAFPFPDGGPGHAAGESGEPDHGHDDPQRRDLSLDPHPWLDPEVASSIARRISERLEDIDPQHAPAYRENLERFAVRVAALDRTLGRRLAGVRDVPYVVHHDAYRRFEARYRLRGLGAVRLTPEHSPGARHLRSLTRSLAEQGARCLFVEPQLEPRGIQGLVRDLGLRTGELDPLGVALTPGPEAYFELMERLAENLTQCLSGSSS